MALDRRSFWGRNRLLETDENSWVMLCWVMFCYDILSYDLWYINFLKFFVMFLVCYFIWVKFVLCSLMFRYVMLCWVLFCYVAAIMLYFVFIDVARDGNIVPILWFCALTIIKLCYVESCLVMICFVLCFSVMSCQLCYVVFCLQFTVCFAMLSLMETCQSFDSEHC